MLKIDDNPTFTREVTVHIPKGRGSEKQTFFATFVAIDDDEAGKFDLSTNADSKAFLRKVVVGLDEIEDAEGKAMPFSHELLEKLMNKPWSMGPLADAYLRGVRQAAEGN